MLESVAARFGHRFELSEQLMGGCAIDQLGDPLPEATLEACHLRFRPIVMTSFAFILGVAPLAVATGAGSASQRAIGTGVMGGMVTATVLAEAIYKEGLKMIAAGYQFVTLASDGRFLAARAADEVAAVRKTGVSAGKLPAY